jgi:ribonuclease-3
MSPDEDKAGGRQRQSIVADCLEALIGAVYADGGLTAARDLVQRLISFDFDQTSKELALRNFKGELLEYVQSRGQAMPVYEVVRENGPDHRKVFEVDVTVGGKVLGSGKGESKKGAEQRAAQQALRKLKSSGLM